MARINTYTVDTNITDNDIIIGSDADNSNETKNFNVGNLRTYMLSGLEPEVGGNLKITTIVDNESEETTPEGYFNNSVTPIIVLHYEIVFLILNGKTFIFRKNNDTYGVDETQVVSGDFTEIDITSVINANLQDLESVLNQGRTASLPPEVPSISLENEILSGYGNVRMGDSNDFIFNDGLKDIAHIKDKELQFKSSTHKFTIQAPSLLINQTAALQNASGTIAYLSDIPTDYISEINTASDELSSTVILGVPTISFTPKKEIKLIETRLVYDITGVVYFSNGGAILYSESLYPINAIDIEFNNDIFTAGNDYGFYVFHYEGGNNVIIPITYAGSTIEGNILRVNFNLSEYWNDTPGSRLSFVEINLYPKTLTSEDDVTYDGHAPSSQVRYFNSWV